MLILAHVLERKNRFEKMPNKTVHAKYSPIGSHIWPVMISMLNTSCESARRYPASGGYDTGNGAPLKMMVSGRRYPLLCIADANSSQKPPSLSGYSRVHGCSIRHVRMAKMIARVKASLVFRSGCPGVQFELSLMRIDDCSPFRASKSCALFRDCLMDAEL